MTEIVPLSFEPLTLTVAVQFAGAPETALIVNELMGVVLKPTATHPVGILPIDVFPVSAGLTVIVVPCVREMTSGDAAVPLGDKNDEPAGAVVGAMVGAVVGATVGVTAGVPVLVELPPPPHAARGLSPKVRPLINVEWGWLGGC
jgi:hypothetical protein